MLGKLVKGALKLTTLGCETGIHMTRYRMYHDIEQELKPFRGMGGDILSVSWSSNLTALLKHPNPNVTSCAYPDENLLHLSYKDNSFDFVMSDQVLEHVEGSPQQAIDETYRVLKPGGIAVHTTCLMQELHEVPQDYWRFTPYGLRYLFRNYKTIIKSGSWGNRLAFFGFRYLPVPHAKWHPIHKVAMFNQVESPMMTWIIGQK
jgi:SAM-dependent methyltransferase